LAITSPFTQKYETSAYVGTNAWQRAKSSQLMKELTQQMQLRSLKFVENCIRSIVKKYLRRIFNRKSND